MRNLIQFFIKYNHWFLFLLLEVISLTLIVRFNRYQQSVFFSSANVASGWVYEVSNSVTSYFHLKSVNEDLLDRNMELEQQIANLQNRLYELDSDTAAVNSLRLMKKDDYELYKAKVVNNTLINADNYITINKGSLAGIKPDMGVIDRNGIVGIVYKTSPSYSLVISLLNSKSNISCKIAGSDYFGHLKWDDFDPQYAYLQDLPRHAVFQLGDEIITSGYSTVFPEGIMVGTVDDMFNSDDGLSYILKIKLATDFGKLTDVRVIARENSEEQKLLEN